MSEVCEACKEADEIEKTVRFNLHGIDKVGYSYMEHLIKYHCTCKKGEDDGS